MPVHMSLYTHQDVNPNLYQLQGAASLNRAGLQTPATPPYYNYLNSLASLKESSEVPESTTFTSSIVEPKAFAIISQPNPWENILLTFSRKTSALLSCLALISISSAADSIALTSSSIFFECSWYGLQSLSSTLFANT